MAWIFYKSHSIHFQLVDQLKKKIVSGEYSNSEKFPSVRNLAQEIGVNPNTLQIALQQLEREGLLTNQRTSGRNITTDSFMLKRMKENLAKEKFELFIKELEELGFKKKEQKDFILQKIIEYSI